MNGPDLRTATLRRYRWPAAVVAGLLLAAFLAWPYLTAHRIKVAVRDGDTAALADLVDFPRVRQGLKDQLTAAAFAKITRASGDGTGMLEGLGLALAGAFIDNAVDALVTPAGVARLVSEGYLVVQPGPDEAYATDDAAGSAVVGATRGSATGKARRDPFIGATMSYESFDRFAITVKGADGRPGRFVLRRAGLGWKLTDIIVPLR